MKFSVLMSLYSKESVDYLDSSLKSICYQTLLPDEIVLVLDGQITNKQSEVIKKWQSFYSGKFHLVNISENVGLSSALNHGLKHCENDYIVRMDTDDICISERFEVISKYVKDNPDIDIVGSYARKIDEHGNVGSIMKVPIGSGKIFKLIWTCPMIHPTVCYKKDKIIKVGGYDPTAGPRQDDYDLWYRCAIAGYKFDNIPIPLLYYRHSEQSVKKNNVKVGYHRLLVGLKGNKMLKLGLLANIGVVVPFIRSLFPYPLNVWIYRILDFVNPRNY